MKISRIFAGVSACAVAALSLAVSASAADVVLTGSYTMDSSNDATKECTINLSEFNVPEGSLLTQVTLECASDWATPGWVGGEGAVSMNFDGGDTWYSVSFAPAADAAANWTAVIAIDAEYNGAAQDLYSAAANGGIFKIGWWWGADATLDVSSITLSFEDAEGDVTTTTTTAVTTTTVAETTTTATETTTVAETEATTTAQAIDTDAVTTTAAVETTTTSATTAADASPSTGVEGVASIVALLTLAGAAVAVAKKH